jgi:hypothetical protein
MDRRNQLPPELQRQLKVRRACGVQRAVSASLGLSFLMAAAVAATLVVAAIPH